VQRVGSRTSVEQSYWLDKGFTLTRHEDRPSRGTWGHRGLTRVQRYSKRDYEMVIDYHKGISPRRSYILTGPQTGLRTLSSPRGGNLWNTCHAPKCNLVRKTHWILVHYCWVDNNLTHGSLSAMRRCRQERCNHVSFPIHNAWLRIDNPLAAVEGPGIAPEVTRMAPLDRVNHSNDQAITMTGKDIRELPRKTAAPFLVRPPLKGPYLVWTTTGTPSCKSSGMWGTVIDGSCEE
jgi:hypothetical protein